MAVPEIEQDIDRWIRELLAAGWTQYEGHRTIWKSPGGDLYRGPYQAWQIMKQVDVKR
jgi:hypothetical protein